MRTLYSVAFPFILALTIFTATIQAQIPKDYQGKPFQDSVFHTRAAGGSRQD